MAFWFFLNSAINIEGLVNFRGYFPLPLMVHHSSDSVIIVGIFASLLRGGAIMIQLYAAFHAQAYKRVLPYLGKVFFFRWISWLSIGLSIFFIGDSNKPLTLFLIGLGLFFFSFSAGFGAIYFKELQAKPFSKKYRGKTMANRQVAGSIASIISGGVAGYVLNHYDAPLNYAYLFMVSSIFMIIGFVTFMTIEEPEKEHVSMPFVVLHANSTFTLTGWMLGGFITVQMLGSIIGSTFLWRQIDHYENMLSLSFVFMIAAFILALFADNVYTYAGVFFLFGVALDGLNISGMNLVIEIAPEEMRPIYTALQTNLTSIGLFFPILGGIILKVVGSYTVIYLLSIVLLTLGLMMSLRLKEIK